MAESLTAPAASGTPRVSAGGRIGTLDILRGLALLGMIFAHLQKIMAAPAQTAADTVVEEFVWFAVAEKDRAIFAFLFGVSFTLMMRQLEAKGLPVVRIFLRRLLVLYVIGVAVEVLTRFTILREYAFWGVPLLFLRNVSSRALLLIALLSAAAFSLRDAVDTTQSMLTRGREATVAREQAQLDTWEKTQQAAVAAEAEGRYAQVVALRFDRMLHELPLVQRLTPDIKLGLFILGLLAVRHGIFDDPRRHVRLIVAIAAGGAAVWAIHWWLIPLVPPDLLPPRLAERLSAGFGVVDEQLLAFTYIGAITLLFAYRPGAESRWVAFAWVGRMALTNYIVHAAVIDFAAAHYGLGLRLRPALELFAGVGLFGILAVGSALWLKRFRFGPFEWAWRILTYWRWQPAAVVRPDLGSGAKKEADPAP